MVLQGDEEASATLPRDVSAGATLTVAGSLPVVSLLWPIQKKNGSALLHVLTFTGKTFVQSGTFWDIVRSLYELRRRIRAFSAHNEPRPAVPDARSQRTTILLFYDMAISSIRFAGVNLVIPWTGGRMYDKSVTAD